MDIKKQYNKIGNDYIKGQKDFFSKREGESINFIKKSLPELDNKKILDIGCGNGVDIKLLESLGGSDIFGLDPSQTMIDEAKKIVSKPENLIIADIENTTLDDNSFDIIIGRFSFHYLNEFDKAYEELARILKKDGLLILIVHHPLRDLTSQKNRKYGEKEIITVELYNNKVPIHFPTHTLKEYFSNKFFEHFLLAGYQEEESPEEYTDEFNTPGFMGIKAIKK